MPEFSTVEDTLFVPMLGRIHISERFPNILNDKKALELKDKLPKEIKGSDTQTEYTLIASAVRSTNMDFAIKDFLKRHPDGVIAMLGAGLETTFYRNDNGKNKWYEIDLPDVINYRREILGENERDICIAGDAFSEDWILRIREENGDVPVLVTASGLFYYFEKDKVVALFKMLRNHGDIEIVFDAVNSSGMKRMGHYMKQVGHSDVAMYFYVDKAEELQSEVGAKASFERTYYENIPRKGLKFSTKISMFFADKFKMVKMVNIILN